ncbi:hypothetical protein KEM52_005213 [Ascosphaera acerosa]|nr:hypothetical protein KEM52_005213 [Ascosphaera acerosa]
MTDVVNFCILMLFRRSQQPGNVLTQNLQRADSSKVAALSLDGVIELYPSGNVSLLKNFPWSEVPCLIGDGAVEVLLELFLQHSVFTTNDEGVLVQISGTPLSEEVSVNASALIVKRPRLLPPNPLDKPMANRGVTAPATPRSANDVVFVRRRLLYAKPMLSSRGTVSFGLKHVHVLNRYPDPANRKHTVHLLKHIFPRAFNLHNVFTSPVDRRVTTAPLMDYTMREAEIRHKAQRKELERSNADKVPRRLRSVLPLVARLQKLHSRCSYKELLMKHCPIATSPDTYDEHSSDMTAYASRPAQVCAFARAVLQRILPNDLFGEGDEGLANRTQIMHHVGIFIELRRFESLSLHTIAQGVTLVNIGWLTPPHGPRGVVSPAELRTRSSLMLELLYYIFDSLLIPLIRSNFYVTESAANRNRLFYFRHDVWRALSEPHLARLKREMLEELPKRDGDRIVSHEAIGQSTLLRILPKKTGARPLMNLRRRPRVRVGSGSSRHGAGGRCETRLGASINYLMKPVYDALTYERSITPGLYGSSAISNVTDIYPRLKMFRSAAISRCNDGLSGVTRDVGDVLPAFFFVKLDVQSCFDTIPQETLLSLVAKVVPKEEVYQITPYEMITTRPRTPMPVPSTRAFSESGTSRRTLQRRHFSTVASCNGYGGLFSASRVRRNYNSISLLSNRRSTSAMPGYGTPLSRRKRRSTVLVPRPARAGARYTAEKLLDLLTRHVKANLVRIGKKYYRQRKGIPQGSVVSSLLCNLFYAEHERKCLAFLREESGHSRPTRSLAIAAYQKEATQAHRSRLREDVLLLRMVDDYLLITTDKSVAVRFLHEMLIPHDEFGMTVNPDKTLVNFKVHVNGVRIPQLPDSDNEDLHSSAFPFCGTTIDTRTLALGKDSPVSDLGGGSHTSIGSTATLSDSLTVELNRTPGRAFYRKMLQLFKLAAGTKCAMFLDVTHNGRDKVMENLRQAVTDTAIKMLLYEEGLSRVAVRSLAGQRRPSRRSKAVEPGRSARYARARECKRAGISATVWHRTVRAIIDAAVHTTAGYNAGSRHSRSVVTPAQAVMQPPITPVAIRRLATEAFLQAFERRCRGSVMVQLGPTVQWLRAQLGRKSYPARNQAGSRGT